MAGRVKQHGTCLGCRLAFAGAAQGLERALQSPKLGCLSLPRFTAERRTTLQRLLQRGQLPLRLGVSNAGTPGVPTVTLNYGYDQVNNRTSMSDSLGGSMSYTYDAEHNLTSESLALNGSTGPVISFAHDSLQRSNDETRSDGTGHLYDIDSALDSSGRLTNLQYYDMTASATVANYTYAYDAGDEVTSYQDANSSLSYSYDHTGQLLSATGTLNGSNYSASWSYDANGNRNMTGYQTGTGNELLNDGTFTYTYDKNGNTLTKTNTATGDHWTYTWDYHNQMTEAVEKTSNGTVENDETFTYDVQGRLTSVNVNGTQQRWTVFDGTNVYMDFNGAGSAVAERYVVDARVTGTGNANWYVADRLGSIRQIVDTSGNVLDATAYDPWGNIVGESNPATGDRFKFDGGQYDPIQQSYLFTARWENPQDGRWETPDPSGLGAGDANLFRFAHNSPLIFEDVSGLAPLPIVAPKGKDSLQVELGAESAAEGFSNWKLENPGQFTVIGPDEITEVKEVGILGIKITKATNYVYGKFWIVFPDTSFVQAPPGQTKDKEITLKIIKTTDSTLKIQGGKDPITIGLSVTAGVTNEKDEKTTIVAKGGKDPDSYERTYLATQVVAVTEIKKGGKLGDSKLYYTGGIADAKFKSVKKC